MFTCLSGYAIAPFFWEWSNANCINIVRPNIFPEQQMTHIWSASKTANDTVYKAVAGTCLARQGVNRSPEKVRVDRKGCGGAGQGEVGAFLQPLSQRFPEGNGTSGAAKIKEGDKHLHLPFTYVALEWRKY